MNTADVTAGRNTALDKYADLPIWLCWQNEEQRGKPTKVPWSPTSNGHASVTDPSTWSTRAVAERSALANGRTGIGIVLAPLGEDRHLGGIDLDSCIDAKGELTPWGREIVELVASYAEVSPSGRGLKIFFEYDPRETLAESVRWRSAVRRPALNGGKDHGVEFYVRGRYFAVTGNTFEQFDTVRHVGLDTLRAVQAKMEAFADKPKAPTHHPRCHDDDQQRLFDAIAHIANSDLHWNDWTRIGMAIYAETGGSAQGHAAFLGFSRKSTKFDPRACDERWQHWYTSPPDRLSAGTLYHEAKASGWQDPRRVKSNGAASSTAAIENDSSPPSDWPEIDPALAEGARREIPVFPVHLFPSAWRDWIVATAEGAGAPVDYVALALLACVAGVTGCGVTVQATPSWSEPLILWLALVGAPSTGKSPALDQARQLLDALEAEAKEGDEERRRLHETNVEASKVAADIWREVLAIAAKEKTPAPVKPAEACQVGSFVPTQFVVGDTTIESIVDVVKGNPRGVVLWRDELTGWLMNVARYGGGNDRPFWLERWSAASATVNRKNRPPVHLPRLGASIVGGIQPDRLGEIFAEVDDGMAARLLYAYPRRPPYTSLLQRRGGRDDRALARLRQIGAASTSAENPLVLKLDVDAVRLLDEFCAEHHAEADEYEGLEAGWFGKGRGYVVRLAGVLSLLAWSETDGVVPPSAITAELVGDAAGLWADYLWHVARATFASAGKTQADRQARRIIAWIRRTEASTISPEDVRVRALGRALRAAEATALIDRLVGGGVLRPVPSGTAKGPGRPAYRWDVNPAMHTPKPEGDHA